MPAAQACHSSKESVWVPAREKKAPVISRHATSQHCYIEACNKPTVTPWHATSMLLAAALPCGATAAPHSLGTHAPVHLSHQAVSSPVSCTDVLGSEHTLWGGVHLVPAHCTDAEQSPPSSSASSCALQVTHKYAGPSGEAACPAKLRRRCSENNLHTCTSAHLLLPGRPCGPDLAPPSLLQVWAHLQLFCDALHDAGRESRGRGL